MRKICLVFYLLSLIIVFNVNKLFAFEVISKGVKFYQGCKAAKDYSYVQELYEISNIAANDFVYARTSNNSDISIKPITYISHEGYIVIGFCALPHHKWDAKIRFMKISDGEKSNILSVNVDVSKAKISDTSSPKLTKIR